MPLDDGEQLERLAMPYVIRLFEIAWNDAYEAGFVDMAFSLELPEVQEKLAFIGLQIRGIAQTTLEGVQELQGLQAREGWSVEEYAQRLVERGLFGIERATLIAQTETARAYSLGSLTAWQRSGQVDRAEWLLGINPCPDCQPLGGTVRGLGEEFTPGVSHPPYHPRCTCALAPVLAEAA